MKITELKCPACGAVLKVDENNLNIGECEYCGNRVSLEWEGQNVTAQQPAPAPAPERIAYTPIKYVEPVEQPATLWGRIGAIAFIVLMCVGIWKLATVGREEEPEVSYSPGGRYSVPAWSAADDEAEQPVEAQTGLHDIMADFVESVYGRPAEEVTEGELAAIQWLEVKTGIEYRQIGYSYDNPFENPEAELVWVEFPRDAYSGNALDCLPTFTGLKMLSIGQKPEKEQLAGLSLQGICGNFDSLDQVAELVDHPELLLQIDMEGNPVSLTGIEKFPALETLVIDSDVLKEERLLVSATSLKSVSLDLGEGTIDFSLFGMMPWLEELNITCDNMKDISFVREMDGLKTLGLEDGILLTLDPLRDASGLTELSVMDCDELKDMSAVSALTGLKKLTLDLPYDCPEPDLSALTGLEELYLRQFDHTGFLRNMNGLETLVLDSCASGSAADFAGLKGLKTLKCTSFGSTGQDYGFITGLPALENLDLHGTTTYDDISGIFNMPTLKNLNLNDMHCEIAFDRIAENTTLETLSLNNVSLYENAFVTGGGGVYSVYWDDVELVDHLDALGRLKGLKSLSICGNKLTEISFASSLEALQSIDFSDNYVTDITPLAGLKALRQVICADNPISNYNLLGDSVSVQQ